jgi:hypothetical protein
VEKCPTETYTPLGMAKLGAEPEPLIKAKMRPYCSPLPEPEYARLSVQQLVNNNICPPWYSTCLSFLSLHI